MNTGQDELPHCLHDSDRLNNLYHDVLKSFRIFQISNPFLVIRCQSSYLVEHLQLLGSTGKSHILNQMASKGQVL